MSKEDATKKLEAVAIEYAQNRKRIAENDRAIRKLRSESASGYIDLAPHRERYLSSEFRDDHEYSCTVWHGWVRAVQECHDADYDNGIAIDEDFMHMAVLMDEKKELNRECSKIRQRLRILGNQLIKNIKD